jgi:proline dehydrogenase
MGLVDRAVSTALPLVPRPVVRRVAARYIAGEQLADATRVVAALNAAGKAATIDVLGEEVRAEAEVADIVQGYLDTLDAIEAHGLDSTLSVKPTALGLALDPALCLANVETIARAAAAAGTCVTMDMEDSTTTTATLAVYRELREAGIDNVGIVLQSRLKRTLDDVGAVAHLRPRVRVCKGIYLEPPQIAYQDDRHVGEHFVAVVAALLDAGAYVELASHDEALLDRCLALVRERGLSREQYECQVLLGVRPDLGDRLVAAGHRLRVYVPYGRRWYEYSVRRLQENPQMATAVALGLLRR